MRHNRVSISLRLFSTNGPSAGSCHVPRYLLFAMVQSTLSKKVLESRCVSISKTKTPFRNTFLIFFLFKTGFVFSILLQVRSEPREAIHSLPLIGSRIGPRIVCWNFFHDQ